MARAAHGRGPRQPGGDQRDRACGGDDRPGVPGRAGCARLHARPRDGGEVAELAPYAGAFSARARQIETNIDRYEAEWRGEHPGEEPGPVLRQVWDRRAWADARPDKVVPSPGRSCGSGGSRSWASSGSSPRRGRVRSRVSRIGAAGPRRGGRDRADPARVATVGVERRRRPRRGRAAHRLRRRGRRRRRTPRAGRGPHRPRGGGVAAAARPRRRARARPVADLAAGAGGRARARRPDRPTCRRGDDHRGRGTRLRGSGKTRRLAARRAAGRGARSGGCWSSRRPGRPLRSRSGEVGTRRALGGVAAAPARLPLGRGRPLGTGGAGARCAAAGPPHPPGRRRGRDARPGHRPRAPRARRRQPALA